MKKAKPTVAAAGIPKNLCPRTFQTFKMEENKGYGAAPGMPRNLAKHEENETCGAAAGMSKNLPPGTLQMGGARVCRGTFQNMKKTSLTSSRGYSDEPSKT